MKVVYTNEITRTHPIYLDWFAIILGPMQNMCETQH